MATQILEDRMAIIENELTQIKRELAAETPLAAAANWKKMLGIFAESDGFEEATRLGREYRESQRPQENPEIS